jgi:gliding motility-associated-like protein
MIPQYDPLALAVSNDTVICYGDGIALIALATGGAGNYIYDWPQLNSTSELVQVAPLADETYTVNITDQCGYSLTENVLVEVQVVIASFVVNYVDDYTITVLNGSTPNATIFQWDFGDGTTDDNEHSGHKYLDVEDHVVTLTVFSDIGCVSEATLDVYPTAHIYVPNSFTPDGDGINDFFGPVGHDIFALEMRIFDRWGNEVYYTNDINRPWDGKPKGGNEVAQDGVYVYTFSAVGRRMEVYERKGSVTLVK